MDFGVMELADDELIVPLDDYLELMPDIVSAVGEERMDVWRSADGHIYTIPSVSNIHGSFSMMIRQDWLDALGMEEPDSWEDWLHYWRGVRDNDLNGNGDTSDEIPLALAGGIGGERCLLHLMNAFGIAAYIDTQFCILEEGTYTMVYEHPRYAEFLEAAAGLYAEGIISDGYKEYSYSSIEEMMGNNTLGSTMTFAASGAQTASLRDSGDEDALWISTAPLIGPHSDRMIPERELVTPMWCITAGAKERGKVEDIVRFFNWCYTQEGAYLYNYGIEVVSYIAENGVPVIDKELAANGFEDYRAVGINYEPFGGCWLQDAYMQCLFAGKGEEELTDIQQETYNGLFVINNDYFYIQPPTLETQSYVKYRTALITDGVCVLRDKAIRGEISAEEFWTGYEALNLCTVLWVQDSGNASEQMGNLLGEFYLEEITERNANTIASKIESKTAQISRAVDELDTDYLKNEDAVRGYISLVQNLNGLNIFALVDENGMVYTADSTFSGISRFGFLSEEITDTVVYSIKSFETKTMLAITIPVEHNESDVLHIVSCFTAINVESIISAEQLQNKENRIYCRMFDHDGNNLLNIKGDYPDGQNLFDIYESNAEFAPGYSLEKMKEDWKNGQEGYCYFPYGPAA